MPTSVETKQSKKAGDKRSSSSRSVDLLCSVKYKNNLPDVPFGPKFLSYPFDSQRYIQYNPTSLERNHNHELLTEVDLGIPIDLVLPETYENNDPSASLDPTDAALLEEEVLQQPESKRAKQHARNVSWLRRTEYISTEYSRPHSSMEGAENKVGYSVKKRLQSMDTYKDRASQITAIEATFEAAKQPITKHYSKPGVTAKTVHPLFPDFDLWKLPFAQVIFDSDPAVIGKNPGQQSKEMSRAMIRSPLSLLPLSL
jgi:RNA polymerase II-associated factor 1